MGICICNTSFEGCSPYSKYIKLTLSCNSAKKEGDKRQLSKKQRLKSNIFKKAATTYDLRLLNLLCAIQHVIGSLSCHISTQDLFSTQDVHERTQTQIIGVAQKPINVGNEKEIVTRIASVWMDSDVEVTIVLQVSPKKTTTVATNPHKVKSTTVHFSCQLTRQSL